MPDLLFQFANAFALLCWLQLLVCWWRDAKSAWLRSPWPYCLLSALYACALVCNPGAPGASFFSLAGVRAIFSGEWGALAGWIHYLLVDLFAGVWIVEDASQLRFKHKALLAVLLLTLFFAPLGLVTYLLLRKFWIRPREASSTEKSL